MIFTYVYGITASVTLFSLFVYFMISFNVSRARRRYGVQAPAVHGPIEFERVHRVQVNTTEQLVLFLPLLWLTAVLTGDLVAGVIGIVWPVARIAYALSYYRNANRRGPAMGVGMVVNIILFLCSIYGLVTYTQMNNALYPASTSAVVTDPATGESTNVPTDAD